MDEQIIIDVKLNADKATDNIIKFREALQASKEKTKEQKKELQELEKTAKNAGGMTAEQAKQAKQLNEEIERGVVEQRQYTRAIADNQKVMAENINVVEQADGSIKEMRKQVAGLTTSFESLSEEERKGAKGKELQQKLAELNGAINEASLSTKNFKDNIGNYRSALEGVVNDSGLASTALKTLGIDGNTVSGIMGSNMVKSIGGVDGAFKMLSTNPIMLVITVLASLLTQVFNAVKKNQEAMDTLNRVVEPTKLLFDAFGKTLGVVAGFLVKIVENTLNFLGVIDKADSQISDLRKKMEEDDVQSMIDKAEREKKIAELQDMQANKEKYTHKERIAMAEEIGRLRDEQLADDEQTIIDRLKLFDLEHEGFELTREELKKRTEIEVELINLQTARSKAQKEQTALINRTITAIKNETQALEEQQRKQAEAYQQRLNMQAEYQEKTAKELEDALIKVMEDGEGKELELLRVSSDRRIDEIKNRLLTEQNLTAESKENLNNLISILEEEKEIKLMEVTEKYRKLREEAEINAQLIENEMILRGADEAFSKEMQRRGDEAALKLEIRRQELDNEYLLEQEIALQKQADLLAMDEETKSILFASNEAYELALLQADERVKESSKTVTAQARQNAENQIMAIGAIAGALSSLMASLADQGGAMAQFGKALALVEIASNTAKGISGAVASGAGVPFPGNIPAIATGVGAVVAGVVSAKNALSSSQPKKPSILGGGGITVAAPNIPQPQQLTTATELGTIQARTEAQRELLSSQPQPIVRVVDIIDTMDAVNVKENL